MKWTRKPEAREPAPARAQAASKPLCATMDLMGMPITNDGTGK